MVPVSDRGHMPTLNVMSISRGGIAVNDVSKAFCKTYTAKSGIPLKQRTGGHISPSLGVWGGAKAQPLNVWIAQSLYRPTLTLEPLIMSSVSCGSAVNNCDKFH